jgi:hypothetical protein
VQKVHLKVLGKLLSLSFRGLGWEDIKANDSATLSTFSVLPSPSFCEIGFLSLCIHHHFLLSQFPMSTGYHHLQMCASISRETLISPVFSFLHEGSSRLAHKTTF